MTLARFIELWTLDSYPPEPVTEADLTGAEQRLNVRLPDDYRNAVLAVGLPRPTIALLDAVVDHELDLHCVGDFYSPAEIVEATLGWRALGMPDTLVAFAGDVCGNKFCFDADRLKDGDADSTAIWFYDHDFETVEQVAVSFDDWLEDFCQVEPSPGSS